MIAFGLSIALFVFWLVVGSAVITALHTRRNALQNLLLAPSVGLAAMVLPIFWLNRAGLPVGQFGTALGLVALPLSLGVLWWARARLPLRRYVPFAGVFLLALVMTGRPLFEFGFEWISYANDDMANYVLGSHRVLAGGFHDVPTVDTLTRGRDYTQSYWFFHVPGAQRAGSELNLAWVSTMTGLTGHQVFMPVILALHLTQISAAGALVCWSRRHRLAALLTCLLVALSALTSYGALYQLIAQVAGIGLLATCATLLMRRWGLFRPRVAVREGLLLAVVGSALLVVYPEVVPFLGVGFVLYTAVGMLRRRSAAVPRSQLLTLAVATVTALVFLNRYAAVAAGFLYFQATGGSYASDNETPLFPYFLIPSGLPTLWGLTPIAVRTAEPWLSVGIVLGGLLLLLTVIVAAVLTWRGQPVATIALVMLAVGVLMFYRRADFALYKLAMFVQPFMLGALVVALVGARRPSWRLAPRVLPLALLAAVGLVSQSSYLADSRGAGSRNEVRGGSQSRINAEFQQLLATAPAPVVMLDTANVVVAKFQALYARGREAVFPSRDFFASIEGRSLERRRGRRAAREDTVGELTPIAKEIREVIRGGFAISAFDLRDESDPTARNPFTIDVDTPALAASDACELMIGTTPRQIGFNRRHFDGNETRNFFGRPCSGVRDHLIFTDSELGQHYYLADVRLIGVHQLEGDRLLPGRTMSGVGRHLLFQVLNPSPTVRLAAEVTVTLKGDGDNGLPPMAAVGAARRSFPILGRGSARVFSPPLVPQEIDGRAYLAIDMGAEAQRFRDRRGGLMNLYGTDIPLDRRWLVGFARDVSVISEEEYARLAPPSALAAFPADLTQPDLEYSGLYEDGWVSEAAFFGLSQPAGPSSLAVRGLVPLIGDPAFTTQVRLLVDGREVTRRALTPGEFELRVPAPADGGRRRVELRFSETQHLPGDDLRPVAGQLRFVGFETLSGADDGPRTAADIIASSSGIGLGPGWHLPETRDNQPFRWAESDAQIAVAAPAGAAPSLSLDIEPGPGVGSKPFALRVLDDAGREIAAHDVAGRQRVEIRLPPADGNLHVYRLHADGGRPTPDDPRILDFRVFGLDWGQP